MRFLLILVLLGLLAAAAYVVIVDIPSPLASLYMRFRRMFCSKVIKSLAALPFALAIGMSPVWAQQDVLLGQPNAVGDPDEPITVSPSDSYEMDSTGFGTEIGSISLDAPSVEAAGLAGAGALGLDEDMWGDDGQTSHNAESMPQSD